jgi:pimeloyl-ACP methyl ester carboxylesterase
LLGFTLFVILVGMLGVGSAAGIGRTPPGWLPDPARNLAFDLQLALSPEVKKISSVSKGLSNGIQVYIDNQGETIQFVSDGLTIRGSLYSPPEKGIYPAILIVHGSSPEGRKSGLYRVLGKELSERGYVVMTVDMRGFGESDAPKQIDTLQAFDFPADIKTAAAYLVSLDNTDPDRIYTIGHSAGADQVLWAGIEDERVKKIIVIGPSRRIAERYGDEQKPEFHYFQRRMTQYMSLSQTIPDPIFVGMAARADIEQHVGYFSSPAHKPLLLIDGGLEDHADLIFLQEFYNSISEPKRYLNLPGSDHYGNTANWGRIVLYDQIVISSLVEAIDQWLSE